MKLIDPLVEVEKYDGLKIMKNIERACRNCFVEGTEILTEVGWKKIENLEKEKVLTYNPRLNIYQYEDNNLLIKEYDGKIIECTHANINFEITPEHRLYCSSQFNRNYELISADNALKNIKRLPKWFENCKALNNNDYVDTISHSIEVGNRGHNTTIKEVSFEISDDLLNLIGAYISEGHINHIQSYLNNENRDKKCGVNIQITQKEDKPLYAKVIQALNNLNLKYRIDKDPRKPSVKWIIITGGLPIANWFITECGYKSANVHLPNWFRKLSVRQLNVLKDVLYEGDGSHSITRNERYLSVSTQLLDDIQELFILIGKSASKSNDSLAENHRDSWKINPRKHIIYKNYKGKVYCTQTINGIICIRKNNKTMWIGNCYRSEGLITDTSYKSLIKNCINRGHESVLEHEKITVRITADIGTYKDLTRHRFGSFSVESTRYCNYGKDKFDNEIKIIKPCHIEKDTNIYTDWYSAMQHMESFYMRMVDNGAKPDQLRMILPHSTAAQYTMTANIREWRHILDLRTKKMTHPSIRQILIPLLLKFKRDMPELFENIEYDTEFDVSKYATLKDIED